MFIVSNPSFIAFAEDSGSVIITEIGWMGTEASYADEWIEFYNRTDSDISVENWSIYGADTGKCINFSEADGFSTKTIRPYSYFLYGYDENVVKDVTGDSLVDIWDSDMGLNNSSPGKIELYDSQNCTGTIVDEVNRSDEDWFAGDNDDKKSMERVKVCESGMDSDNWKTNDPEEGSRGIDAEGNTLNATPKATNSVHQNENPMAEISGTLEGEAGSEFEVTSSGSTDCDGYIESYRWDLDNDGDFGDAEGLSAEFRSKEAGEFRIKLKVTDDEGGSDTEEKLIVVSPGRLSKIGVSASPQTLIADGNSTTTITALAKDRYGNPKGDIPLSFTTQSGVFASESATTDSSGQASVVLTAPEEPNESTVKAMANGTSGSTTVFFQEDGGPDVESSSSQVIESGKAEATIDSREKTGTSVTVQKSEQGIDEEVSVTVAKFSDNPQDEKALNAGPGGYLDVNVENTQALDRATVRIYFDPWPTEPRVRYWSGERWADCTNVTYNRDAGYALITMGQNTQPSLADLSGQQLAGGGLDTEYLRINPPGWSMVSAPLKPEDDTPTEVFKGVDPTTIFHYDRGKGKYITPEEGYKVEANKGTWIYLNDADAPKTFTMSGVYDGSVTINLEHPGWHQVGSPLDYGWSNIGVTKEGEDTMTVAAQSSGPSSPHWMSKFIWNYDTETKEYTAYEAGNSSFNLEPGKAYWVRTREENVKIVIPHAAPPPVPSGTNNTHQTNGIPMTSTKADRLGIPNPPAPPATLSVGEFTVNAVPNPLTSNDQVTFIAAGSNLESFQVNIYDSSGKQVLASRTQNDHTYTWKPQTNLTNGLYIYQVTAQKTTGGTIAEVGKLLVLK